MSISPEFRETNPTVRTTASTPGPPPQEVIEAIEAGVVRVTRRIEIHEADGKTRWRPDVELDSRLIDGNLTVDYNSAERRKLDLVLDNRDFALRANPSDGFWYDKVIKVFRGVKYQGSAVTPRVAILEAPSQLEANRVRTMLSSFGLDQTAYMPDVTSANELTDFAMVVAWTGTSATTKAPLLRDLWNTGKHVLTMGTGSGVTELPHYTNTPLDEVGSDWGIAPVNTDSPVAGAFSTESVPGTAPGTRPTGVAAGASRLSVWVDAASDTLVTAALITGSNGAYWADLHLPAFDGVQTKNLLRALTNFLRGYHSSLEWETQQGEFVIDVINDQHFPDQVKITGRDYTKKMLKSKLGQVTTFAAGTSVKAVVQAVAANSGITKMRLSIGTEVLASEISFDRGVDRWQIAKSLCDSHNYEIFFDAYGVLVVRKFIDPTTGPVSWTYKTGPDGNLVSYERSLSDSNIYNHIIVISEPSDGEERLPYFGEARNTDPESPTRIERLGEWTADPIHTPWLTSDAECAEYAQNRLKITALESYSLNISTIYYPWQEVGEIVEILDPRRLDFEPTRFLLDNLTFPIALGPMGGSAKRITFVGSSGSPDEVLEGTN